MATKSKASATTAKATTTPVDTNATVAEAKVTTEKKEAKAETAAAKKTATTKKAATTTKKTTAAKKATTATKKTTSKKSVNIDAKTVVQYAGKEVVVSDVVETVKKLWVEKFQGKLEEIKTIEIYVKPEENKAYFVVNGLGNGDYFVEL